MMAILFFMLLALLLAVIPLAVMSIKELIESIRERNYSDFLVNFLLLMIVACLVLMLLAGMYGVLHPSGQQSSNNVVFLPFFFHV